MPGRRRRWTAVQVERAELVYERGRGAVRVRCAGSLTNSGSEVYGYDSRNELVSGPGVQQMYRDPLGLVKQLIRLYGSITSFDHAGSALAARYENGAIARRYVYGPRVDEPLV